MTHAPCPPLADLMRAHDWPGAERCARRALDAVPHPPASTYGILGRVLAVQDRHAEAAHALDGALRLEPRVREGWLDLARAHHAQYRSHADDAHMARAADALEHALRLSPADVPTLGMLSDAYHRLSRGNCTYAAAAIDACRRSLALEPSDSSTWSNLATVLGETGAHSEAVHASRQAVQFARGDDEAANMEYAAAEALLTARRRVALEILPRPDQCLSACNSANISVSCQAPRRRGRRVPPAHRRIRLGTTHK